VLGDDVPPGQEEWQLWDELLRRLFGARVLVAQGLIMLVQMSSSGFVSRAHTRNDGCRFSGPYVLLAHPLIAATRRVTRQCLLPTDP
jgi:hypothetical protein